MTAPVINSLRTSRERLIDAATALSAQCGFGAVSVQEIGEAAGMSRGAVNFRFGSKEGLYAELVQVQVARWSALADAVPPSHSVEELIEGMWDAFTADPRDRRAAIMLIYDAMTCDEHRAVVAGLRRRAEDYVRAQLDALSSPAAADAPDSGATARLITSAALGLIVQLDLDEADPRRGLDALLQALRP